MLCAGEMAAIHGFAGTLGRGPVTGKNSGVTKVKYLLLYYVKPGGSAADILECGCTSAAHESRAWTSVNVKRRSFFVSDGRHNWGRAGRGVGSLVFRELQRGKLSKWVLYGECIEYTCLLQ